MNARHATLSFIISICLLGNSLPAFAVDISREPSVRADGADAGSARSEF